MREVYYQICYFLIFKDLNLNMNILQETRDTFNKMHSEIIIVYRIANQENKRYISNHGIRVLLDYTHYALRMQWKL
jgi:hypothetical protein